MTRQAVLVLLVGLNLLLLGAIVLSVYTPPAAYGQAAAGRAGDYLLVSGRIAPNHNAVYLFDLRNRLLHVFRASQGQPLTILPTDTRDLSRDFRPAGAPGERQ
jgi:hypothetical protein